MVGKITPQNTLFPFIFPEICKLYIPFKIHWVVNLPFNKSHFYHKSKTCAPWKQLQPTRCKWKEKLQSLYLQCPPLTPSISIIFVFLVSLVATTTILNHMVLTLCLTFSTLKHLYFQCTETIPTIVSYIIIFCCLWILSFMVLNDV